MSRRIELPDLDHLLQCYVTGEPEQKLALESGVSRALFRRRLIEHGITPRNVSDSMFIRWRKATPEQRQQMVAAAHVASKGRHVTERELLLHSATNERNLLGAVPIEYELSAQLIAAGLHVTQQKAVGVYNVDVAINEPPVAVEIFGGGWHASGRHAIRFLKRTEYLLDHSWSVVIVWIDSRRYPLGVGCVDYLVALSNTLRNHPTPLREYRVILGDGTPAPVAQSHFNTESVIERLGCG